MRINMDPQQLQRAANAMYTARDKYLECAATARECVADGGRLEAQFLRQVAEAQDLAEFFENKFSEAVS